MRRAIPVLVIAALVTAAPRAQRGDVRLRVIDFDSGLPILRAQLTSASTQAMPPTFSDEHGDASVDVPAAGRTIRVSKPGYVPQLIPLTAGSDPIDVKLPRGAAIGGRVIDTLGAPVMRRPVLVTASSAPSNQPLRTVYTDDRGEYRIGSLPEGRYTVALNVITTPSGAAAAPPPAPPDVLPHIVVVRRGDEVAGIDFALPARPGCRAPSAFGLAGNELVFSSISGRVTTIGGAPIGCVEVTAFRGANPVSSAVTDHDGRYSLRRLRGGGYRIEFKREGFVSMQWDRIQSGEPGQIVAIRDRENRERIDISLPRGGALTGIIADEYGEPVENVTVRALHLRGEEERAIAVAAASAQTDDRGRYRLFNLIPGRYIVGTAAATDPADRRTGRGIPPAYYPGTVEIAGATPVDVVEETDREWTDFVRAPARVVTITGTAVNSRSEPVSDRVMLVASQRSGAVIAETQGADVTGSDGAFTIPNVPPGDYVLQATSKRGGDQLPEFGMQYVTISDSDPLPVRIQTRPGADVSGRLIQESEPPVDPRSFLILAVPVDWDQTSLLAGTEQLTPDSNGFMAIRGLSGPRRLVLASAPENWFLKAVLLRGRDVTDDRAGFQPPGSVFLGDLQVVVSSKGASIDGDAFEGQAPVADYSVVLFSSNPDHWFPGTRFLRMVHANGGKFHIDSLPDGDYYVAALDPLAGTAGNAWRNSDFLQSLITFSRRVRLREGEGRTLSLPITHR
jgi:hypothetical protein